MNVPSRTRLADELSRRFAAAVRGAQLYAPGHPLVARSVGGLIDTLRLAHESTASIAIGIVGDELVVGEVPVPRAVETMGEFIHRVRHLGIERIVIDRGVQAAELEQLVDAIARAESGDPAAALGRLPHIRVGRLDVDKRSFARTGDIATFRRLYDDAVRVAGDVWESARVEGAPDAAAARDMIDSLVDALVQNRTALLALTALKDYDNYTFTHMINVSILTMAQARGLGLDGALLREFGLSGLMHDIGKVEIPSDILNQPRELTEQEFTILKQHPVYGAEMLRNTPEMPALAPIVAFEHHLRADGTGYPAAVRSTLNLGTTLAGIADVYDAMRSQRIYQSAFPADRILAVLQRNDGKQFDQHLVRRFVQLVGIYPAGNLVRLDTGEIAVVLEPHAPDPHRPGVRILLGADGEPLTQPLDLNLWEDDGSGARSIEAPVNPADHGIDPLLFL